MGATFTHEIEKIGKLELVGCEVGKFKVFRTGDGRKKPKRLMLAFSVTTAGTENHPSTIENTQCTAGPGCGPRATFLRTTGMEPSRRRPFRFVPRVHFRSAAWVRLHAPFTFSLSS